MDRLADRRRAAASFNDRGYFLIFDCARCDAEVVGAPRERVLLCSNCRADRVESRTSSELKAAA